MKTTHTDHLGLFLLKGILIGIVATQALDWVGSAILEKESDETWDAENATRGGKQAYEVTVSKIANGIGFKLTREEEQVWGWRLHKTFGVLGGLQYLSLREKNPKIAAGLGLAYGASFFLLADEILIYLFKLTPGPQNFSWKVHARGAIAHTAYGVAAESAARALDSFPETFLIKEDAFLFPKKWRPSSQKWMGDVSRL